MTSKELKKRIIDLSFENRLSHIGSCLTAVGIIDDIYKKMKPEDKFVLSSGHAHLAHLVAEEKYKGKQIKEIHDIHCNLEDGCEVATGSLGQGLPIAVGMALADRDRDIYCLISDGECAEGSIWESLRIASEQDLQNLKVYCNANGYGAYGEIDTDMLEIRLNSFFPVNLVETRVDELSIFEGLDSHYKVLKEEEYRLALEELE